MHFTTLSKNYANEGGAIYAASNPNDIKATILNIYNSTLIQNGGSITTIGGAISMRHCTALLYNTNISGNIALNRGGGLHVYSSTVNISSVVFKSNKCNTVWLGDPPEYGGGGLWIGYNTKIIIREASFISNTATNKEGNEILTYRRSAINSIPVITIVNSYFSDPNHLETFKDNDHDYLDSNDTATWITCITSPFTVCNIYPFTGPCTQKDANNPKLGVTCNLPGCILGTYYNETTEMCLNCPHGKFGHTMNAFLPENQSCTNCPYGRYNNQSGLTECNGCPKGRYGTQPGAISLTNGCQNCAAGTFGNATGAENKTIGCTECPFGTYDGGRIQLRFDQSIYLIDSSNVERHTVQF